MKINDLAQPRADQARRIETYWKDDCGLLNPANRFFIFLYTSNSAPMQLRSSPKSFRCDLAIMPLGLAEMVSNPPNQYVRALSPAR